MKGKLLTPSYSHGPLAPCFPVQQTPSNQKLWVLALGRWLHAGLSRELKQISNVPLVAVGERVPGEVAYSLYSSSTNGEMGSAGPGQPLLLNSPSPYSLLPISKVTFSARKTSKLN